MATHTQTAEAVETAKAFASAYAAGDLDTVEELLHPDVRYREVTPGQVLDETGPGPIVEEAREFLEKWGPAETLDLDVHPVASRVAARTLWRLRGGDTSAVVEWCQYLTVEDGRITVIDAVCSGPLPEE